MRLHTLVFSSKTFGANALTNSDIANLTGWNLRPLVDPGKLNKGVPEVPILGFAH
jgi:hypothetical protein